MKIGTAATLVAALALGGLSPALAQDAKPRPQRAPGVEAERINELMVGDRAPELAISEWVKGEPVTGFEDGKVYVVEFWATWCGPCIAGMPHLSELQKEYKDKGVKIIGVNIWDDTANVEPFMKDRGTDRQGKKQPSGDELMQYTVAIEEKIEGEDPQRNGEMAKNWMRAAGRNGIPSAFIVDQRGYIAWAGHPMQMDEPLEKIVAGQWDLAEAADRAVAEARAQKVQTEMVAAFQSGDMDKATRLAGQLMEGPGWDQPGLLNFIAWSIVDPDAEMERRDTALALKAAERAAELTEHKDAAILDTLAWAYYHAGQKEKALATQKKAVAAAPESQRANYEASLERMKK